MRCSSLLSVFLMVCGAQALSRGQTRRCRFLGNECVPPNRVFDKVKLVVGERRVNPFGNIGGIRSFSDIGNKGLTEYYTGYQGRFLNHSDLIEPTSISFHSERGVDTDLLISKLSTSSILRDNIVTVTGYIIYKHSTELKPSLYMALSSIHNAMRSRQIHTTKLLHCLGSMAFEDPQSQLLILFTEIEKVVPEILKCSAEICKNAIMNSEVDLNNIIRPNEGSNIVDILVNLDIDQIEKAKTEIRFDNSITSLVIPEVADVTGSLLAETVAALVSGNLVLTQPLMAMIILHLPFNPFEAEVEESSRFLVDVLTENKLEDWEYVSELNAEVGACPFAIIRSVLKKVLISPHATYSRVKDAAAYLLPHIVFPSIESLDKYQSIMASILVKPKLDVSLLLSYLKLEDFPSDVIDARDLIIDAINTNALDVYKVLAGFIRFDYPTPEELTIGITNRIRRRYLDLDEKVMDAVKVLNSFLVFRKRHSPFSTWAPKGIFDIILMLEAFFSPTLPRTVSRMSKDLLHMIVTRDITWSKFLSEIPSSGCYNPRHCLVRILKYVLVKNLIDELPVQNIIIGFLEKLSFNGEPNMHFFPQKKKRINRPFSRHLAPTEADLSLRNIVSHLGQNASDLYDHLSRPDLQDLLGHSFNAHQYKNEHDLLKAVLKKSLTLESVQENSVLHKSIKVKLAELEAPNKTDIHTRTLEEGELHSAIPDYPDLIPLLPDLKDDRHGLYKRSVTRLLKDPNLPVLLGPEFKPYLYKNKGELLNAVLDTTLKKPEVQKNDTLVSAIIKYQGNVNLHGFGDQIISWKAVSRKVDFSKLLVELIEYDALPDNVVDAYDEFVLYVSNLAIFDELQFGFNTFVWKSKADFTIGLLNFIMDKNIIPENIRAAIRTLIPYVKTTGVGTEIPEYEDTVTQGGGEKLFSLN